MIAINQCSSVIASSQRRSDRGYPRVTSDRDAGEMGTIGSQTLGHRSCASARMDYDAASPVAV
jgi:hypothetical protein